MAEPIQIICNAPSKVLLERFMRQAREGERHLRYGDAAVEETLWQSLRRETPPEMALGGKIIALKTIDFANLDCAEIAAEVLAYKYRHKEKR